MKQNETQKAEKTGEDKKQVVAIGKAKNGEALNVVFFAGKVLYGAKTAAKLLNLKERKN